MWSRSLCLAVLLVACVALAPASADNEGTSSGPIGDAIRVLIVDPVNRSTAYAGTKEGVLKSTDGGATWRAANVGMGQRVVTTLAIDTKAPEVIYAGTFDGLFGTVNGGASWVATKVHDNVSDVAIDPNNHRVVYVCAHPSGLLRTQDGGSTWTMMNNGLPDPSTVDAVAVAPGHPARLYAGLYGYGIFRYSGRTWLGTGASSKWFGRNTNIIALAVDPHTPTTLYAALGFGALSKSTDAGRTWTPLPNAPEMQSLAIDPINSATLYAGTDRGISKSTDGGLTWANTGPEFTGWLRYLFLPIAIDPNEPNTVYAAPGRGTGCLWGSECAEEKEKRSSVFKTTDGGGTWARPARFSGDVVAAITTDPRDPTILYAGTLGGVFRSTDGAHSWVQHGLAEADVHAIVADTSVPTTLYAGTRGRGMFKTLDGGATWREVSVGLTERDVLCVTLDAQHAGTVYAGTSKGIFKSSDAGEHWTIAQASAAALAVEIDPGQADTIYAATVKGVLKSTDTGGEWRETALHTVTYSLALRPAGTLYAGTCQGVFTSTDGGDTWKPSNAGIEKTQVYAVVVDRNDPKTIYIGTLPSQVERGGILRSRDGGTTWRRLTGYAVRGLAVISPKAHTRTIYAATFGHGVVALQDPPPYRAVAAAPASSRTEATDAFHGD